MSFLRFPFQNQPTKIYNEVWLPLVVKYFIKVGALGSHHASNAASGPFIIASSLSSALRRILLMSRLPMSKKTRAGYFLGDCGNGVLKQKCEKQNPSEWMVRRNLTLLGIRQMKSSAKVIFKRTNGKKKLLPNKKIVILPETLGFP